MLLGLLNLSEVLNLDRGVYGWTQLRGDFSLSHKVKIWPNLETVQLNLMDLLSLLLDGDRYFLMLVVNIDLLRHVVKFIQYFGGISVLILTLRAS
jgi:hypothetical protein